MTWETPQVWEDDQLIDFNDLNVDIGQNFIELKDPPTAVYNANESSDYQTTSTTFTNVDPLDTEGKFKNTVATNGGRVLIVFNGTVYTNAFDELYFDITVDGVSVTGAAGGMFLVSGAEGTDRMCASFAYWEPTVRVAGTYVYRLQWRVAPAGTIDMPAGSGAASMDIHPQFWVREVS
jgi:hypothetical protein